jgi:alkylated DNA repair dioxygenase AlkB
MTDGRGVNNETAWQSIALQGAELRLATGFLTSDEAAAAFAELRDEIRWEQHRIRLFGRECAVPRLSCWIGDPGASYRYSGSLFQPHPWTPALQQLRERVEHACDARFDSVLANLYRDGSDGMGWHSDDEAELGAEPLIASLSLGATRRFRLRHRDDPARRWEQPLETGSLLLMAGATQRNYRHDLPRTRRAVGARINLTFRRVMR